MRSAPEPAATSDYETEVREIQAKRDAVRDVAPISPTEEEHVSNATQTDPDRENRAQRVFSPDQMTSLAVTAAAETLGLPGKTPAARAQLLRRLEARGILPPARRTVLSRERYYLPEDIQTARRKISEWRQRPRRRRSS